MATSRFVGRNTKTGTTDAQADVGDLTARYQALQARGQEMAQRRMRREVQLESLTATDKTLSQQAEALGMKTPEDFLELIEAREQSDKDALDHYEAALNEEEALLDSVDLALQEQEAAE